MKWLDMMKMIVNAKPDLETTSVPKNKYRRYLHYFVAQTAKNSSTNKFDLVIMGCIVLNMFQMAISYEG